MRNRILSTVATALVGAGSALAQTSNQLPSDGSAKPASPWGVPALLSADPAAPPPLKPAPLPAAQPSAPVVAPTQSCGSTGGAPGVDCCVSDCCGPRNNKFWFEAAYMLAWIKEGPNAGPLAISTPVGGPFFGPGSNQTVLIGDETDFDTQNGGRLTAGMWFGCDNRVGFEASGFLLERTSVGDAVSNNGDPNGQTVIIRPFVNADTGLDAGVIVGGPNVPGNIIAKQSTRFWGAEGNFLFNVRNNCDRRWDLLAGFTYYDLQERLAVNSFSSTLPQFPPVTQSFNDVIDTRNQFYGGQLGLRTRWTRGKFALTGTSKLAMGVVHEEVDRFGTSSRRFANGTTTASNTGFLVQTSNRGRVTDDRFAVALPSDLKLSYQVTDHMSAFIGYDFVYLSRVARPGDQVDLTRQTGATGTAVRPLGGIHVDDFWMNALMAGVRFAF